MPHWLAVRYFSDSCLAALARRPGTASHAPGRRVWRLARESGKGFNDGAPA